MDRGLGLLIRDHVTIRGYRHIDYVGLYLVSPLSRLGLSKASVGDRPMFRVTAVVNTSCVIYQSIDLCAHAHSVCCVVVVVN